MSTKKIVNLRSTSNSKHQHTIDVSCYEGKSFDERQMQEISFGFEHGLDSEQIDVYAKPAFDRYQMCQIRVGYENGLSHEQVEVFADPKYNAAQICELRVASELGMSLEEISELAHPEYTWQEMWRRRVDMRQKAVEHVSLKDAINEAEVQNGESMAPEHFKQEGFVL